MQNLNMDLKCWLIGLPQNYPQFPNLQLAKLWAILVIVWRQLFVFRESIF
uniref:Uncharacterized protein n=1 Tax=Meloidogyne enterolobii TaxID=390850 RepID=A0A6V7Y7M6_MELEN|nr:unnamed protein product [Meloidogyne enterolobii]